MRKKRTQRKAFERLFVHLRAHQRLTFACTHTIFARSASLTPAGDHLSAYSALNTSADSPRATELMLVEFLDRSVPPLVRVMVFWGTKICFCVVEFRGRPG
jgi:hypothetical protein